MDLRKGEYKIAIIDGSDMNILRILNLEKLRGYSGKTIQDKLK